MRRIDLQIDSGSAERRLVLSFDDRRKARLRVVLDDGSEAALMLPRGTVLRAGDLLRADDGVVVAVEAAPELLSIALTTDQLLLARAAYHLGNRHVALQVLPAELRYRHDHVLDGMVRALGLEVRAAEAGFEPEAGAYQGTGPVGHHHHEDQHDHPRDHAHAHAHK